MGFIIIQILRYVYLFLLDSRIICDCKLLHSWVKLVSYQLNSFVQHKGPLQAPPGRARREAKKSLDGQLCCKREKRILCLVVQHVRE